MHRPRPAAEAEAAGEEGAELNVKASRDVGDVKVTVEIRGGTADSLGVALRLASQTVQKVKESTK